ncbi:hypothetical protein [Aestuariispira insulae]|uniref:Lipoprotein n=1 Tax=Aestuariispira insulae TaxID=1461337 RepID=A0A3D9HKM0_9PROT|nr:hypothetical protein [Aestuariispira insulae]RED49965.1 hypothetical protein DFP90_105338 [Aestuariispira insulae]
MLRPNHPSLRSIFALTTAAALLAACQVPGTTEDRGPVASAGEVLSSDPKAATVVREMPDPVMRIPGLPIPDGVNVVLSDTVIAGQDNNWNGQVVLFSEDYQSVQFVEFMRSEMPKMGWEETAILRSRRTSITYVQGNRFATVRIMDREEGAEMDIVVAPVAIPESPE